ncbi:hypothetical protein [Lactococcus formosensis]|jgi:hypothetical protein|uniref:Uncharacterized protein n=1 Tax=Lactococcus formosensis TaxID=1281486 RepID=A0A9Q9D6J1_9LACT|nr:hypothetical protein [Lactococcus formosensis]MCO7181463.1 hypothetical protein [Lactococcus formosensis]MDG6112461.1 hypothetical protein [Lactococcus formosensis]MDG6118726.1 hypothetical protein [Lactococcus formosensis]MDG6120736.1 hypothetical protein [Lactococcus formosensis]MDG6139610.1 hypothetical protein [Lactococcus formosensis]
MFYEHLDQSLLFVFFVITAIFYLVNRVYQDKKEKEYHNDDRWRMSKLKAKSVSIDYVNLVMVGLGLLFIGLPITFGISLQISVERLAAVTFNLLMLRSMIEYFALRYFDKRM